MITPDTSPQELAIYLGTTYPKLTYIVYGKKVENFYTTFEIDKKNGEKRVIKAPHPQLKILQQRLNSYLVKLYKPHIAASAFIEGRGIVYNAKKHIRKAAVFNIDLEDFYTQIHFGRVRGMLAAKPYSLRLDTATLIAHICCVDKVLPQGAPTSPVLSNMISRRMDRELSLLAKKNRSHYSRYADDITFSFINKKANNIYDFSSGEVKPDKKLISIIKNNGFSIKQHKTRLQFYDERQTVTGLKVNRKVNLDRRYIRTTKAMLFSLSKSIENANELFLKKIGSEDTRLENVVSGRINYIGMVKEKHSSVYQTLARKFNNLELSSKLPLMPTTIHRELESMLHFSGYENKIQLERCVWCVSFEDVEGLKLDEELVQGSAFILKGSRIITASHTFAKAGDPEYCFLYRIKEQNKKYKAKIKSNCKVSDIAELEFEGEEPPDLSYLKLAPLKELHAGYKLSAVGFQQMQPGHDSVSIIQCTVINSFIKSTFKHVEVDGAFHAGISGGPVVNAFMQVVGMALLGLNVTKTDNDNFHLEGNNAFISAEYFLE